VPGLCTGPAREGKSHTPSMYADEKSAEVIVPRKRPNNGRQLPAEVVEGRASPKGNSRQAAVVRTLSRDATSIRLAAVRRSACGFQPHAADVRPEGGARCVSSARRDLCGGRGAILVPTATIGVIGIYVSTPMSEAARRRQPAISRGRRSSPTVPEQQFLSRSSYRPAAASPADPPSPAPAVRWRPCRRRRRSCVGSGR
jgi:hypothetical protein